MTLAKYDRNRAVQYALRWSRQYNPEFPGVCGENGNSTNFASQCLFSGCGDVDSDTWNFRDGYSKAWACAEGLYHYLMRDKGEGPLAAEVYSWALEPGDIVQIRRVEGGWKSVVVVSNKAGETVVAGNSYFSQDRSLTSYLSSKNRCLHILGVLKPQTIPIRT